MLGPLDGSVNVAFPLITQGFGLAVADIQWIIVSFIIAQSAFTLVFGKLGDLFGHRRIFRIGLAAAALAHLACAIAPSYAALIALRAIQGVSIGLVMATGPALATLLFAPHEKRRIIAIYLMWISIGFALGPLVGGVILSSLGWPGVFWFRVPIALIALLLSIWLPEPVIDRASRPRLDYLGAVLLVALLSCLILFISLARGAYLGLAVLLLIAGLAALWAFVRHESRFPEPILQMRHFRDPNFTITQIAAVILYFSGFSVMLLLPYALAARADYSAAILGVLLALSSTGTVLASMAGGWIVRHAAAGGLIRAGLVMAAVGLLATGAVIALSDSLVFLAVALIVIGVGLGLFQVGYMDATTSILPIAERGVAGSLASVTRLVGLVFGAAAIMWLYEALRPSGAAFAWSFGILGALLAVFSMGMRRITMPSLDIPR